MRKSVTLIELLMVIIIISILLTAATAGYGRMVKHQRERNAQNTLLVILQAQKDYFAHRGFYTDNWDNLDISQPQERAYHYDFNLSNGDKDICIGAQARGHRSYHVTQDEEEAQEGACN